MLLRTSESADIIVIGGGPVGSYTARRLAEANCKVIVIEKRKIIGGPVCCTGIISQKCIEEFSIDNSLILKKFNGAEIFSPSGKQFKVRRDKVQACVIDRALLDRDMAKKAQASGAIYFFGTKASGFKIHPDGVEVGAKSYDREENFKGKALVIACGFGSSILADYGLGEIADSATGAQVEVETDSLEDVEVYTGSRVAPGFFSWLVPASGSRAKIGLIAKDDSRQRLQNFIAELKNSGKVKKIVSNIRSRRIPLRTMPRTYGEKLVVVGDAAGQVKPTTGGGIYFGLISARIAAENIVKALEEGDFSKKKLAAYEKGWKKRIGGDIKHGLAARRFYEMLSDKQLDRVFDIMFNSGIINNILKDESIAFDWHGSLFSNLLKKQVLTKISKTLGINTKF